MYNIYKSIMEKPFKGKAIYTPQGKAGEYAAWACNFYTGCSNNCSYCYLKKGVLSHCWSDVPQLKKCFRDKEHALAVFRNEMFNNLEELKKHGLFFSFTTDPMLQGTIGLTVDALDLCVLNGIPVKILTKRTDWLEGFRRGDDYIPFPFLIRSKLKPLIAFGLTLTGHDELEHSASTNAERIAAMKTLHEAGFKTFASIEPIIDFESSLDMIKQSVSFCDLFKIGLMSGSKVDEGKLRLFIVYVKHLLYFNPPAKVYWKESIAKVVGSSILGSGFSVGRDYNLFNSLP